LEQQLAALVQAGQLSSQTANLLRMAFSEAGSERAAEAALRILERRIDVKALAHFRSIAQQVSAAPNVAFNATAAEEELYALLVSELNASAQVGAQAAIIAAAKTGAVRAGFDWALVNDKAADWAERYTFGLVRQITDTTTKQLQTALSTFFRTPGMTRTELEQMILWGPDIHGLQVGGRIISATKRAEMIAVTEVTRSYSAGEVEGLRASGLAQVPPREQPPAHVGCRCDISPFPREDGVMSWRWQTLNDNLVCEICAPLHGQDVGA